MLALSNIVRVGSRGRQTNAAHRRSGHGTRAAGRQPEAVEAARRPAEWRALQETSLAMSRQLRNLREGVMRVRMVQVGEIFER